MDNMSEWDMFPAYAKNVLDGNLKSIPVPVAPLRKIFDELEALGCAKIDTYDFDTNGWQIDFTQDISYASEMFCLSGSVYYGEYKFYKYE